MYSFPLWRRAPFIALLVIVMVIAYAPSTTEGTATVRLAALSVPSIVGHIYVQVSSIELHSQGFPNSTGWTTMSKSFPIIDLLSPANRSLSQTIGSVTVHSGRYDALTIIFTNSTLIVNGAKTSVAAPPSLNVNATMLVSPNGIGDILLVIGFDYAEIIANSPSLSFILIRVSSV
jgi:hypothetical protein